MTEQPSAKQIRDSFEQPTHWGTGDTAADTVAGASPSDPIRKEGSVMFWVFVGVAVWVVTVVVFVWWNHCAAADERECSACGSRGFDAILHAPGCPREAPVRRAFL